MILGILGHSWAWVVYWVVYEDPHCFKSPASDRNPGSWEILSVQLHWNPTSILRGISVSFWIFFVSVFVILMSLLLRSTNSHKQSQTVTNSHKQSQTISDDPSVSGRSRHEPPWRTHPLEHHTWWESVIHKAVLSHYLVVSTLHLSSGATFPPGVVDITFTELWAVACTVFSPVLETRQIVRSLQWCKMVQLFPRSLAKVKFARIKLLAWVILHCTR